MKIYNVGHTIIPGCATFDYRGLIVSMSTIFRPSEVRIFDIAGQEYGNGFVNVEEAIAWINQRYDS